jgi:hypothetical protein
MAARRHLLALVAASALTATGCGGGDKGLSKEEYIARADKICTSAATRIRALGTPQSPDQFPAFAAKTEPIVRDGLRRLRALAPPSEIAGHVNRFLADVEKAAALVHRAGVAGKTRDIAELQRIGDEAPTVLADTAREAKAIGYKQCSRITGF